MKLFSQFVVASLVLIGASSLCGCGAGPQAVDQDYVKKSTENAQLARGLFDSKQGNWDGLSASEKKKLGDAYGSEEAAKKVWETMAHPPVGGGMPAPK
jgi:hypothetical protein